MVLLINFGQGYKWQNPKQLHLATRASAAHPMLTGWGGSGGSSGQDNSFEVTLGHISVSFPPKGSLFAYSRLALQSKPGHEAWPG
ncbi:hypothetical protein llap_6434 [Limosa lapponica baueri]|uniref:Uncharacterized protein n=1 Tax=Limosa lapponica baueri TaxID=1758121 RepID=A0A2I0UB31_LIMLA|nr:hypothetical protein llap_6434 [Limosa lapponica baueri]